MNEYVVARIIDEYQIIINAGAEKGITVNDRFEIIGTGEPVNDPITGEQLGYLEGLKDVVQVKQVFDKMALCVPDKTIEIHQYVREKELGTHVGSPRRLNINYGDIRPARNISEDPIKVGDIVRKV
ncbi:MAG: hypothetical protein K0S80_5265 [Neobacillus sp.]|nr:hypothetical protein [Neobacillus sp.]